MWGNEIPKKRIDSILLGYYIKFDTLLSFVSQIDMDPSYDTVDIYIDLYDMLSKLYDHSIVSDKHFSLTATVMNLVGHMRSYFRTRHGLWTRIYLVYGAEISDNQAKFWPPVGEKLWQHTTYYNEIKQLIEGQLGLLKVLSQFINDVYFVFKATAFAMFTYDNILRELMASPGKLSIVLSGSKYNYQIPAIFQGARVYQFRPIKFGRQDISKFISPRTALIMYYNKLTPGSEADNIIKLLNPRLMSLLFAMSGCHVKNMSGITNVSRASSLLQDAIMNNRILNDYQSDVLYAYNALHGLERLIDPDTFTYRFNAIDIVFQHRIYKITPEAKDFRWNINLEDIVTLKSINDSYFIDNPIDLHNL